MKRRDWYLATLGVVRYVPQGVAVEVDREPEWDTIPPVSQSRPADAGRAALQMVVDSPAATRLAEAKGAGVATVDRTMLPGEGAIAAEPQPAVDTEVSRMRMAVWQPAPDLMLFDSLAIGEQPSAAMARLVANISAALGRSADGIAAPQLVDWPPLRGRVSGGLTAARAMASAYCDARLGDASVRLVLLMGQDAANLLLPEATNPAERFFTACRWRDMDAVILPSLAELLGDTTAKRRAWQSMSLFVLR